MANLSGAHQGKLPLARAWSVIATSRPSHAIALISLASLAGLTLWQVDLTWRNLGFGLPLVVSAAGITLITIRCWPQFSLRHMKKWFSLVLIGTTAWGILAFFETSTGELHRSGASLGGFVGEHIIGNQDPYGILRVGGIALLAIFVLAPMLCIRIGRKASFKFALGLWSTIQVSRASSLHLSRAGLHLLVRAKGKFGPATTRETKRIVRSAWRWGVKGIRNVIRPPGERDGLTHESQKTESAAIRIHDSDPDPETVSAAEKSSRHSSNPSYGPSAPRHAIDFNEQAIDQFPPPSDAVTDEAAHAQQLVLAPTPAPSRSSGISLQPGESDGWQLPSLELLDHDPQEAPASVDNNGRAREIESALASYGIEASVVEVNPGPAVTQFGVEPGWVRRFKEIKLRDEDNKPLLDEEGNQVVRREEVSRTRVKVDAIANLDKDLAMALAASSIRIEAPVPGKSLVGVEVPNNHFETVPLRSSMESAAFQKTKARGKLAVVLGKGSGGQAEVADLTTMPHLLVAGATGSGKSIGIRSLLISLLMNATPRELRLLLIDPKRVEMTTFNSVPHLVGPVIVDVEQVVDVLRWAIQEMEDRYKKFAEVGARNLDLYNKHKLVVEPLPYLVIAIDELADLMMAAPYDVEHSITRLAQLGRATGIHMIVATQRPSVDVVTGLIKANFPTRISFAVSSLVDSRTILDTGGAEKLLGKGDMLYLPQDAAKPKRVQGVFVSDAETERVVHAWNSQRGPMTNVQLFKPVTMAHANGDPNPIAHYGPTPPRMPEVHTDKDPLMPKARELTEQYSRVSPSLIQRKLRVGYNKASRLMELLVEEGYGEVDDSP